MTSDLAEPKLHWMELFVGTLLSPAETFEQVREGCRSGFNYVPETFALVAIIFALDGLRLSADSLAWSPLTMAGSITGGMTLWLLSFALIGLVALCFSAEMYKVRASLIALGWSLLPWLFMAPITCFHSLLGPAHVVLAVVPLTWIFLLQLVAINQSYKLKAWQTLCLAMVVPSLLSTLQLTQFLQVFTAVLGAL